MNFFLTILSPKFALKYFDNLEFGSWGELLLRIGIIFMLNESIVMDIFKSDENFKKKSLTHSIGR